LTINFVSTPVAASSTTLASWDIVERTVWVDDNLTDVLDDYDGNNGQKIPTLSGEAPIILHGGSSSKVIATVVIVTSGSASGLSYPGLTVDSYQGASYQKLGDGHYKLTVTGNSFYLGLKGASIEVAYSLKITVTLTTNADVFSGSTVSGFSSSGSAFDGIIYVNSLVVIEIPLDMLVGFENTYLVWITSLNVASGLWIEVQGLYQNTSGNNAVSFYDWIGESPIPRSPSEEELTYYWYVTLAGTAGWYDLTISIDFT